MKPKQKTPPPVKKTAKTYYFPRLLASLAPLTDHRSRYALDHVRLAVEKDGAFVAESSNGKVLMRVSGKGPKPQKLTEDRPYPSFDAHIPNGDPESLIRLNVTELRRLLEALERLGAESVTVEVRGGTRPIVFRSEADGRSVLAALMPMTQGADLD